MNKKINLDIKGRIDTLNKKNFGKNIFFFAMGLLISALAFNLFFEPYEVIPTGSGGLSLLISRIVKIDVSLSTLLVNLGLLILGLLFFGYDYSLKMLAYTLIYPAFLKSTSIFTRFIDLEETSLFLIVVFGGAMMGFSSGLIRRSGYNPGGFSVLYDMFYKYFHISIGSSTLITNIILIICSGFIFGFDKAIYAIISLLVSSYMVDRVIIGISDNKVFYIITDKPLEIKEYVYNKLHYDMTIVNVRGGYTNKRKRMLMCVVPTIEYLKLKELVNKIDSKAFFLIVDAYESSVKKNCKNM